jgi:hypothetical protein
MKRELILISALLAAACASTTAKDAWKSVEARNVYRDGSEAVPSELAGCEFLGRVSASIPEMSNSSFVLNNPSALVETLQKMAAAKGGNVLLYSLVLRGMQFRDRSLSGKAFRCPASASSP